MGPKYNAAISLEELESTKTYRRSKFASKRVKVPNLAQTAKSELLVAVKGRDRPTIPSNMPNCMGPKYNAAASLAELGSTKTYKRGE